MKMFALGACALFVVACSAPARIELKGSLPAAVLSLKPVELPLATVLDQSGSVMAKEAVTVTMEPLGIAELQGNLLVPRAEGELVVRWTASNGRTHAAPISIHLVDEVRVRCLPSCRAAVGETVSIQATAYADGKPQTQLDVPLRIDDPDLARLERDRVVTLKPGKVRVTADLDGVVDDKLIEIRRRADDVKIECPTIFTKTQVDAETTIDVCYVTRTDSVEFRASAMAGAEKVPDERVTWQVLNSRIADVSSDGKVVGLLSGQTTLKVALASSPHIYKQVSLYVDEPRALERLFRTRLSASWSYGSGTIRYRFYAPQCPHHKNYSTRAYAWVGGRAAPLSMTCSSSESVACAAEAGHALSVWGLSSVDGMRGWLGPCCCITDDDRVVLDEQASKLRGGK